MTYEGDEVVDDVWIRPVEALEAMAEGRLAMWLPTSSTLQQLEHVGSMEEIRERLAPGPPGEVVVEELAPEVVRIEMPSGGGVDGQPVNAYLVGRSSIVLVDPGDPTGPGLDRALAEAARRGGSIEAICLTQASPDHAGGAEALRESLDVPVFVGPGARPAPAIPDDRARGGRRRRAAGRGASRRVFAPTTSPSSSRAAPSSSAAISMASVAHAPSPGRRTRPCWTSRSGACGRWRRALAGSAATHRLLRRAADRPGADPTRPGRPATPRPGSAGS